MPSTALLSSAVATHRTLPSAMESPSSRQTVRRLRSSRHHAPSLSWRTRFLSTYLSRIKSTRSSLIHESRQRRHEMLTNALRSEPPDGHLSDTELNAMIMEMEELLEMERREEEEQMIHEQMEAEKHQLGNLQATQMDGIVCPVCGHGRLNVSNGVMFCGCGVRVDTGWGNGIGENEVKERLGMIYEQHGTQCEGKMEFQVGDRFGFRFLGAKCDKCGMETVVL